jgi:signal transduction histidine kinase
MDITDLKKTELKLKETYENLRELSRHNDIVREEERKNIAREVHDELGHIFTALKIELSLLSEQIPDEYSDITNSIDGMKKLIDDTIPKVRSISAKLRPSILDHFGLIAAIEWQAEEFQKRTGISCELTKSFDLPTLDNDTSTAIFRIFQETLTNIARHSQASAVRGEIICDGKMLILTLSDNGVGISEEKIEAPDSFGMMGIRERTYSIGGKVQFKGIPNKGTTMTLMIPLSGEKYA